MCAYIPSFTFKNPIYQPAMRVIAAITNTPTSPYSTVTTSVNHLYQIGTIVRFEIPVGFGMQRLNQQVGTILTIPTPTTFTITVDSRGLDPFTLPTSFPPSYQDAQIVPVGEDNSIITAAVQNVLPFSAIQP